MPIKIMILSFFLLPFFISCGSGTVKNSKNEALNSSEVIVDNNNTLENNSSESNLNSDASTEHNSTENVSNEMNSSENTPELNETIVSESNYTDEELTLSAYDTYITNSSSEFSATLLSLFFKVEQPIENGIAIIKDNQEFTFELNWENPLYAENINFYFSHGRQDSVQYISGLLPENSDSYSGTCKVFENYRFNCNGVSLDESKYYIGRTKPVRSSFIMAVCDRSTRDPNRLCDFIRIPIEFRD